MTGLDLRDLVNAFWAGYAASEETMAAVWHETYVSTRTVLTQPLHAELQALRDQPRTDPCRRCDQRSSCCIRAAAVLRNRELYGADDYPGEWDEVAL